MFNFGKANTKKRSFFRQYAIFIAPIIIACIILVFFLTFYSQSSPSGPKRPARPNGMKPVNPSPSITPSEEEDPSSTPSSVTTYSLQNSLQFTTRVHLKALIPSVIRFILHVRQFVKLPRSRVVKMPRLEAYFKQPLQQPFDCDSLDNILFFAGTEGYCMWERSALSHLGYEPAVVKTEDELHQAKSNLVLVDNWSYAKYSYGTEYTNYSGHSYKAIAVAVLQNPKEPLGPYELYLRAPNEDTWNKFDDKQEKCSTETGILNERMHTLKVTMVLYYKSDKSVSTSSWISRSALEIRPLQDKISFTGFDISKGIVPSIIRYVHHVRECLGPGTGTNIFKFNDFYKPTVSVNFNCQSLSTLLCPIDMPGNFIWDNGILKGLGYDIMHASQRADYYAFSNDLIQMNYKDVPERLFRCGFCNKQDNQYKVIAFAVRKRAQYLTGAYELYLRSPTENEFRMFDDEDPSRNKSKISETDLHRFEAHMVLYQKIK